MPLCREFLPIAGLNRLQPRTARERARVADLARELRERRESYRRLLDLDAVPAALTTHPTHRR